MSGWWWLSFVDPELPEGSRFLGVAIVQAGDFAAAVARAHRLGINPGGEVEGIEMPTIAATPEDMRERLLGQQEAQMAADLFDRAMN